MAQLGEVLSIELKEVSENSNHGVAQTQVFKVQICERLNRLESNICLNQAKVLTDNKIALKDRSIDAKHGVASFEATLSSFLADVRKDDV